MHQLKVAVYSARNLHAKILAFGNSVFIGSANVSKHSAHVLQEAVVRITDAAVARAARDFVKDLCLEPLGPSELKRLQKLYRPPRFAPGQSKKGPKTQFSTLRVAQTHEVDIPDKLDKAFEAGSKEAIKKRRHGSGFYIEEFYWHSPSPFRDGQLVIEVFRDAHGRTVSPPGRVIHTHDYRDGKRRKTLIYLELPDRDWEPLSRFSKELKTILGRGGTKTQAATRKLLSFWERSKALTKG
jgi:hypothetical protein